MLCLGLTLGCRVSRRATNPLGAQDHRAAVRPIATVLVGAGALIESFAKAQAILHLLRGWPAIDNRARQELGF